MSANTPLSSGALHLIGGATSIAEAARMLASGEHGFGRCLIPGLVPARGLTVIYGATGSAKSFFAIHVGLCVAAGLRWSDTTIERGTVAYLASEDRGGIEARAVAAAHGLGLRVEDLPFEILTAPCIHGNEWPNEIVEVLDGLGRRYERPTRLAILDTISAAFGDRDQDNAGPMSGAAQKLLEVSSLAQCAMMALHHTGKDVGRGHRGSQVIKDRSDQFSQIKPIGGGRFTVAVEKARNAAPSTNVHFRLAPYELKVGGRIATTMIVTDLTVSGHGEQVDPQTFEHSGGAPSQVQKLPKDAQKCLDALAALERLNGTPIMTDAWRSAAYAALGERKPDALRQAFNFGKKRLVAEGLITIEDNIVKISA
jgi:hypothetical protein